MSLNETPSSSRIHIGIFGCRNAGKSSLINALTGQNLAVVSASPGTTTDPVTKAMELLPLGPVALIDTAGIDDAGELGALRVEKTRQVLRRADLALLVVDGETGRTPFDRELAQELDNRKIPFLEVFTKGDRVPPERRAPGFWVSAATGENVTELKNALAALKPADPPAPPLAVDLVPPGGVAVLVVPIDCVPDCSFEPPPLELAAEPPPNVNAPAPLSTHT